jgi:hypothetical protein
MQRLRRATLATGPSSFSSEFELRASPQRYLERSRDRFSGVLACLFVLCSSVAALPLLGAQPTMTISSTRITIDGLPRGATIALMGAGRKPAYYMNEVVSRREVLVDSDRDGTVMLDVPDGIAARSLWIAVNVADGHALIGTPTGFVGRELPDNTRGHAVDVLNDGADIGKQHADVMVVRPGKGAWAKPWREFGSAPAAPGRMRIQVRALLPMSTDFGDAPEDLRPSDVMVVIDPESLRYRIVRGNQ